MTIRRVFPYPLSKGDQIDPRKMTQMDINAASSADFFNGDTVAPSATVNVGGQSITMSGTTRLKYASRDLPRALAATPSLVTGSTIWRTMTSGENIANTYFSPETVTNLSNASNEKAWWVLGGLPDGQKLATLSVQTKAGSGHVGLPTMPSWSLKYVDASAISATPTTVVTATDTSASTGAFEAQHLITASAIGHTIVNSTRMYFIEITHETGANYQAGGQFFGALVTVTVTDQPEF